MRRQEIRLFATKADLEPLLRAIESQRELQFIRTGLFDTPVLNCVMSLLNDANLGIAAKGDSNHVADYLAADRSGFIEIRALPQYDGGMNYAIDQQANPKTITFRPGGVFNKAFVIAGRAATVSNDEVSSAIFKLFSKEIRGQFKRIKSYYVGNEAGDLLDAGWRLTTGVATPVLYDLKRG